MANTRNERLIKASPETLYRAFTDPAALPHFLAPGEMTATVHRFDDRVGGGYEMSLYYPESDRTAAGKTNDREDRFTARFVELTPYERIVEAVTFDSADPAFAGEMIMTVAITPEAGASRVSIAFDNIPAGIKPEDNEEGTRQTLEKLARYVE